jgi:transcriptional regulator with XRE-family HTH domain
MKFPRKGLGEAIAELREKHGYTQETLGVECEVNREMIARVEQGRRIPSFDLLYRIAEALEVSGAILLRHAETKEVSNTKKLCRCNDCGASWTKTHTRTCFRCGSKDSAFI